MYVLSSQILALLFGAVVGAAVLAVVEIAALSRVSRLRSQVEHMRLDAEESLSISLPGNDDLSWLAKRIGEMVQSLREGRRELTENNEQLDSANHKLAATNRALANAVEGIAEVDDTDRIVDVNSSFAKMHGYEDEQLAGFHWKTMVASEDHEKVEEAFLSMIETGKGRCEVKGRRRDGSFFYEELSIISAPNVEGKLVASHWFTRDITERKELEARIKHRAFHDTLTGLPNRALFVDSLRSACQRARRRGDAIAVLFLDLDDFKSINDSMGHEAGDQLLAGVAERIRSCVRDNDVVARLGGDEFTVVLTQVESAADAVDVAERIAQSLETPIQVLTGKVFASTSIGIAFSRSEDPDPETLLHEADMAMYKAKDKTKVCYELFSPEMNAMHAERRETAEDLREAIANDQLSLHYQPMIDLASGQAVGIEAFLRWQDPNRGAVPADLLVSVADEAGLMEAVWAWSLKQACRQIKDWTVALPDDTELSVSMNLSLKELIHPDLLSTVKHALQDAEIPADRLRIEVSVKALVEETDRVIESLQGLKQLGVRLTLDDFGTGTRLISKLGDYPFDRVKIDSTVTWALESNPEARALALAMVLMAQSAGLEVVGEGIENLSQLRNLVELGCTLGQGYVFGRPMPASLLHPKLEEGIFIPRLPDKIAADLAA